MKTNTNTYELRLYNNKHQFISLYTEIKNAQDIQHLMDWARFVTCNSFLWTKGLLNPNNGYQTDANGKEEYFNQFPNLPYYLECDDDQFDCASFEWVDYYLNAPLTGEVATGDLYGWKFTKGAANDDICKLMIKDKELSTEPYVLRTDTGQLVANSQRVVYN